VGCTTDSLWMPLILPVDMCVDGPTRVVGGWSMVTVVGVCRVATVRRIVHPPRPCRRFDRPSRLVRRRRGAHARGTARCRTTCGSTKATPTCENVDRLDSVDWHRPRWLPTGGRTPHDERAKREGGRSDGGWFRAVWRTPRCKQTPHIHGKRQCDCHEESTLGQASPTRFNHFNVAASHTDAMCPSLCDSFSARRSCTCDVRRGES
jgi:hypothetical protein